MKFQNIGGKEKKPSEERNQVTYTKSGVKMALGFKVAKLETGMAFEFCNKRIFLLMYSHQN